jgi:serine/threonine protein kinase/tetratricopeptide (TPR) repeat protein
MEGVLVGPGTVLAGRYTIERELGRGGMAIVYLSQDLKHHRHVAIKVLQPEIARAIGSDRFLREIEIAACLSHPHILPLHDSGESGDLLFYVMPYVEGESLRERLRRDGTLPWPEALRIARQVADALAHAHEQGVVHRDIKPGNILLQSGHAVVADFGIARAISAAGGDAITTSGLIMGTPLYMSPEQISRDPIDGRSDVYSLGCVIYEMVTGRPPFEGSTAEVVAARHLYEPVPDLPADSGIPEEVAGLIRKTLGKRPEDRFLNARELTEALEPLSTTPITLLLRQPPRMRSGAKLALLGSILLLGAIVLLSRVIPGRIESPARPPPFTIVADFDGPANDRTLPTAVRELVSAELDQSQVIAPMPRQLLTSALRDAGLPDTARLTESLARELAVRSSVRTVLSGSVFPITGQRYSIVLRVADADSGKTLVSVTRGATDQDLIPSVQSAAREVRRDLGERRSGIASNRPLVQVATPSFPAYRKYVEAVALTERGDVVASNRLLQEAVALDTGFAAAWGTIASNYLSMRNDSAGPALEEALKRPNRLSDVQRYRLQADADHILRYDLAGALRWYDLLLQVAPRSLAGHNNRAALLHSLGRYEEALAGFRRTEELEPFGTTQAQIEIFNQMVTLLALGRDTAAAATAKKLSGLYSDYAAELLATYRGEWKRAESLSTDLIRNPSTAAWLRTPASTMLAGARVSRGAAAQGDQQLRAAAASAQGSAKHWFCNALLLLSRASGRNPGRPPAWLLADSSAGGLLSGGLWAAMTGDVETARQRYGLLQKEPVTEQRRLGLGPSLLGGYILAAQRKWPEVAGQLRTVAIGGELDGGDLNQVSSMAVRWLMAETYEHIGKADSAAVMYRLVIDPTHTPFTHLALRGLVYPYAMRRLEQLRELYGRAHS